MSNFGIILRKLRLLSSDFFSHPSSIIDPGAKVGSGTRIWHFSHVSSTSIIGEGCSLGQNVYVADGVTLGRNCKVQNNVSIYTGVHCEDDVFLGPSMVFTNVINPRSAVERKDEYKATPVRKGATIGANATIVCGNSIGAYALVAAGSVVTRDVKDFELVIGVPARHAGWVSAHGHRLTFNEEGQASCPETGEEYILESGLVRKKLS